MFQPHLSIEVEMDWIMNLDTRLLLLLNGREYPLWLDRFFIFITDDHNLRWPMILLWLYLLLACGPRWRRRALWLIPLVAVSDSLNSQILKELFTRPRPCAEELEGLRLLIKCGPAFSFPSSHAANMGAAGVWLTLGCVRWSARTAVMIFPILVAYSRIHVGVHYPLDIVGGVLVGALLAILMTLLVERLPSRFGGFQRPLRSSPQI